MLSRVPHDHVVAIHRVDETEEWLWLVLEYVSGGTLKERLTEPMPPRDAARLMETIARAVGYFHARGVCHLDLKPSNILLEGEPGAPWEVVSPKVSDFGIARLEGEPGMTETGANGPKGTPSYMAPEQVAALPGTIGPAADLHALGALLYHLLTGRPPFQGASSADTLDQVRNQDPVPPRRLNSRIPRDLETICLTCLEKAPNRRYRSAEALSGDLRLWLDGRPITARRVSPMGHAWRLCRRHPAVASLLVTLAMTLATGVVGLFVLLNQVAAERTRLVKANRDAKVYEKFSTSAVDHIGLLLRSSIHHAQSATQVEMETSLLRLCDSTSDLINQGILPSSAVESLERDVGWALASIGKHEEALKLSNQAVAELKRRLAKNPEARLARQQLYNILKNKASFAEGVGKFENALNSYEDAFAIIWDSEPGTFPYHDQITEYTRLQDLADRLERSGRTVEKDRAQRLSHQILVHLLGSEFANSSGGSGPELEARTAASAR